MGCACWRGVALGVVCTLGLTHRVALAQLDEPEIEVVVQGVSAAERERRAGFEASQAVSVTDHESVLQDSPKSLADALRSSPSASAQQTTPGQGTVYVRGLSGRALMHSIDGVRLNTALFRAGNNDVLGLVDPYSLELVRVVPGASSVRYGGDALGGGVVMSTTSPEFHGGEPALSARFFQSLTTNPLGTASRAQSLYSAETFGAVLGFTYYQAGPVRPGAGQLTPDPQSYIGLERDANDPYRPRLTAEQEGTEFEFYATDFALRQRTGRGQALTLRVQHSSRPELVRYDQITPRFKRELPQRAERSLSPMSRTALVATWDRRALSWWDHTMLQASWQRIFERRKDRRLLENCITPDLASDDAEACLRFRLEPAARLDTEANISDALSFRAETRGGTDDEALRLTLGLEARYELVSSQAEQIDLQTFSRTSAPPRYPDGSALGEVGVYAHGRYQVLPRLHLNAGIRGSAFPTRIAERGGDLPSPAVAQTLYDVSLMFGAHLLLAEGVAWVANAGRGVRGPNVEDFSGLGSRAQGRFQVPNPELGPEHSYTADTGFKVRFDGYSLQTLIFAARYTDAIVLAPTTVNGQSMNADGEAFYHSRNASHVDYYGFEAAGDLALTSWLALEARALRMLGAEHNPAEIGLPASTPADRVPPAQAELGFRFSVVPKLTLRAYAQAKQRQDRLNDPVNLGDNRIPEGGTPGYVTYHARANYDAGELVWRLGLDNLSNERVLEHGSGFYLPGFSATLAVEGTLD